MGVSFFSRADRSISTAPPPPPGRFLVILSYKKKRKKRTSFVFFVLRVAPCPRRHDVCHLPLMAVVTLHRCYHFLAQWGGGAQIGRHLFRWHRCFVRDSFVTARVLRYSPPIDFEKFGMCQSSSGLVLFFRIFLFLFFVSFGARYELRGVKWWIGCSFDAIT